MRKEYELTEEELESVLEASKPVPVMYLSGGQPMFRTPQQNANSAWRKLAEKYGFVWDTVEPITGKEQRFVTAEVKG